jgi:hypothetical protein
VANFPAKLVWAPQLHFHDPNPPLPLVDEGTQPAVGLAEGDSVATAVSVTIIPAVGLSEGDSVATAVGAKGNEGVGLSIGDSIATAESAPILSGAGLAEGDSVATGVGAYGNEGVGLAEGESIANAVGVGITAAVGFGEGDSADAGVGVEIIAAVGLAVANSDANAAGDRQYAAFTTFTYTPADPTVAAWNPRRSPDIGIDRRVDDGAPNSLQYVTDEEEPIPGQHVTAEFDAYEHFQGPIVRVEQGYDEGGEIDSWIWKVTATDYTFHLNRRVPFGCWENTPVNEIVEELMDKYADDFTYEVDSDLPEVDYELDGQTTMTDALRQLAQMATAHFKLDVKHLTFFVEDTTDPPDVIDDNNPDLLRDPQVRSWKDISQLRTRVMAKGAEARVLADANEGASSLLVEGFDLFEDGDEVMVNGQRIRYGNKERQDIFVDTIVVPDTGSFMATPRRYLDINATYAMYTDLPALQVEAFAAGRVKGRIKYYVSIVDAILGESQLSDPVEIYHGDFQPFRYGSTPPGFSGITAIEPSNDVEYHYLFIWRMKDGQQTVPIPPDIYHNLYNGNATVPGIQFNNLPVTGYPHVDGIDVYREKDNTWFLVARLFNGTMSFQDLATQADLVIPLMSDGSVGIEVRLSGIPTGGIARKIYRSEDEGPTKLVGTINDGITDWWVDNRPVGLNGFPSAECPPLDASEGGYSPAGVPIWSGQAEQESPPEIAMLRRYRLTNIPTDPNVPGYIHCRIKAGSKAYPWVQVDDLDAQVEAANKEGKDGIHEFTIPFGETQNITTRAELLRRCQAYLILYSRALRGVIYATRDRKTAPNKSVSFNLTNPPIVGTFKIQDVKVDQIHIADELVERYTVTAISVLLTIEDLLRRIP